MTGFSSEWLALREPADHAARNSDVLAAVSAHFAGHDRLHVVDLGCGTASNLRGCAPALPRQQIWTLVDHDPALLKAARTELVRWANTFREHDDTVVLIKDDREIEVIFRTADLVEGVDSVIAGSPDLVTAAALFDLMSAAWIGRFAATLVTRSLPLYTVLTYDGRETWSPPHPLDNEINRAFIAHQRTDKGFGPAAGPDAPTVLSDVFGYGGYLVTEGLSPWRLAAGENKLRDELARGIADAVRETGQVTDAALDEWLDARRGAAAMIGHVDLFAAPRP